MGKSIKKTDLNVGDLVLPIANEEFLFTSDGGMDYEVDPIEKVWSGIPGIILEVAEFKRPRKYMRVRIMVGQTFGWTYSDYVEIVSSVE